MKYDYIQKVLEISKSKKIDEAIKFQKEMEQYISLKDEYSASKIIAGVDLAYTKEKCYCAIIIVNADRMIVIEESYSNNSINFPYIPGLLFYREFPVFYEAYEKIKIIPDIIIFDGQGLSHQRMMGIATMSGILLDKPTIGCAKSHLYSDGFKMPENKKFSITELTVNGLLVGYVLRSKENIKPIFISTGYKVSPQSSLEIVKKLITNYKLPLPVQLAHNSCEKYKKE